MERSFANKIESLKLGDGEVLHGEGILAVTRASRRLALGMADERHSVLDTALRREDASGGVPVAFTPLRREPANVH